MYIKTCMLHTFQDEWNRPVERKIEAYEKNGPFSDIVPPVNISDYISTYLTWIQTNDFI